MPDPEDSQKRKRQVLIRSTNIVLIGVKLICTTNQGIPTEGKNVPFHLRITIFSVSTITESGFDKTTIYTPAGKPDISNIVLLPSILPD